MIYNNELQNSNNKLQSILETINTLPEAGGKNIEMYHGVIQLGEDFPPIDGTFGDFISTDANLESLLRNISTLPLEISIVKGTMIYLVGYQIKSVSSDSSIDILLESPVKEYGILPNKDNFIINVSI